jgi:hypothetical protein
MENKTITTLGKSNKAFLRTEFGFKNISQAIKEIKKDNPEVVTANDAYELMRETHNQLVEDKRNAKKEAEKKRKQEEKKAQAKRSVEVFDYKQFKINEVSQKLYDVLSKYVNKNIVVDLYFGDDKNETYNYDLKGSFSDIWNKSIVYDLFYPKPYYEKGSLLEGFVDGDEIPQELLDKQRNRKTAMLYIYQGKLMDKKDLKKIVQVFRDADNGKCVFNPIQVWATAKYEHAIENKNKESKSRYNKILNGLKELEEKYPNGVHQDNIDEVCNKLQIDISIEKPLCDEKFITCKSIKKALKHFRYLNTRLNHVELNEYVANDKPNIVSRKDLLKMKKELTDSGEYHTFNKDLTNISKIQTLNGVYSVSNEMQECFNEFEIETGLNNCKLDDIDDAELSSFVKWGTHYNGTIDFKDLHDGEQMNYELENVFHIDMSKAYSRFKMCKFYEGFLGKITDFRLTKTIQGVGLYYIYDLVIPYGKFGKYNDTLKIYQSHNIYTSFELKFLESKGCTFKILSGCWGVKPLNFDFNDEMMNGKNDDGNTYYALWTGKCDSHRLEKKTWINGDANMCSLISEHTTAKIEHYENGEICVKYDKKHNYHLGHITAFITAYQRLNVLEQLDMIDYDNVIRICVDGIYTEKVVSDLKNAFRHKNDIEDKTFANRQGESFISNLIEDMAIGKHIYKACGKEVTDYKENIMEWKFGDERKNNAKELHIGAGGNGKTHKNLVDKGLVKVLYVSPSWKLARNKQNEYGCKVSVWARLITEDPEMISLVKRYSNVLLIDECSMMTEGQKQTIFDLYGDMKIIFCGDLGFQLSCWNGDEMKPTGFDDIIQNNINYRCKDSRLLALLDNIRNMIKNKISTDKMNNYVLEYFKTINKIMTFDKMKQIYKVDDMILVGTKLERDDSKTWFPELKKYYCLENNRKYCNGEIVIGEEPECKNEMRHAYTTHSIQGETAYHNLFIISDKMFNTRMFYTAISRAKTLDQVFIIA